MSSQPATPIRAIGQIPLLIGFLAGPILWSVHLLLCETLVSVACSTGANGFNTIHAAGVSGWRILLLAVSLLLAGGVFAADVIAYRAWKETRIGAQSSGDAGGATGRSDWMAVAGMLLSTLFLIGILLASLPIFWLRGCG